MYAVYTREASKLDWALFAITEHPHHARLICQHVPTGAYTAKGKHVSRRGVCQFGGTSKIPDKLDEWVELLEYDYQKPPERK